MLLLLIPCNKLSWAIGFLLLRDEYAKVGIKWGLVGCFLKKSIYLLCKNNWSWSFFLILLIFMKQQDFCLSRPLGFDFFWKELGFQLHWNLIGFGSLILLSSFESPNLFFWEVFYFRSRQSWLSWIAATPLNQIYKQESQSSE